jgi:subtilisin-like proprotein convertase family protein
VCAGIALGAALPATGAAAAPVEPTALPSVSLQELEPNDDAATATAIPSGERVRGNLFAGDLDYYQFFAQAGERIFANTVTAGSSNGSAADTVLAIRNGEGVAIEEDDNDGSQLGKASSIAGFEITETGLYYLRVSNAGASFVTPYDLYLQLRSGPLPAEVEPNNEFTEANPLESGEVSGERAGPEDKDWFSIQLQAGDTVYLALDLSGESSKAQLGFGLAGDPPKQLVLAVPASGESFADGTPSEALAMTVSQAGTYYARVGVGSADESSTEIWQYDLSATVIPASQPNCRTYFSESATIPDGGAIAVPIAVGDPARIERAAVGLNLEETAMDDLDISLRNPAGVELPIADDIGSSLGEGAARQQTQMQVVFDDFAAVPPMYKALRPLGLQPEGGGRLALLAGQPTQGTWSLVLRDDQLNASAGTLRAARLIFCGPDTASSGSGSGAAKTLSAPSKPPPVLSGLTVAPGEFAAAKSGPMILAKRPASGGALVSYSDTEAAQTNFILFESNPGRKVGARCVGQTKANAAKKPCTRWVKVISFVRNDIPGRNRFGFTGRVGARKLPPGEFQLQARAYGTSGLTSNPVAVQFKILRAAPIKASKK